jgi:hypothetical protein
MKHKFFSSIINYYYNNLLEVCISKSNLLFKIRKHTLLFRITTKNFSGKGSKVLDKTISDIVKSSELSPIERESTLNLYKEMKSNNIKVFDNFDLFASEDHLGHKLILFKPNGLDTYFLAI